MMVEAVEGLCTETEYCRSADEINAFEKALVNSGATLVKIWLEISPQEQLKRFRAREEDPMKSWKITEEDWRNRSKWDVYDLYVNSMMKQTNTPWAPWTVVESEDKKYGRLKVLDTLIDSMKKALD
ncbi:Polyphosphate:AMP phosphotransferase [bioreactor metagenome]|uniref:Polyphosphate:AMP phosphotransferase n=1 Tax=bioreactor metagenome TaxID=1076179 RepID=A0A645JKL9_9ZZZZ